MHLDGVHGPVRDEPDPVAGHAVASSPVPLQVPNTRGNVDELEPLGEDRGRDQFDAPAPTSTVVEISSDRAVRRRGPELQDDTVQICVTEILVPQGARRIALFGSRARGSHRPGSDLDLLVRFERTPSLLRLAELEERLEEALGVPVDLVTERSLSPYIRDEVLREARVIYG
jgi:predicted nucleotidyltransferase